MHGIASLPTQVTNPSYSGYISYTYYLTIEFLSRRRSTTRLAHQSNMYGMLRCMCRTIFDVSYKHNYLPLGSIHPSSPSSKELHVLPFTKAQMFPFSDHSYDPAYPILIFFYPNPANGQAYPLLSYLFIFLNHYLVFKRTSLYLSPMYKWSSLPNSLLL